MKHSMWKKSLGVIGTVATVSALSLFAVTATFADYSNVDAAAAVPAGASSETALPITGGSDTLNPGQSLWYGFNYAGDGSQVNVILNAQGQSGLSFGVWTPDLIHQYEAGWAVTPIGMGSPNADVQGADLFWSGNFDIPATYYVMVTNNAANPITYNLSITGGSVTQVPGTATMAAAPVTTTAVPAPAPAPAAAAGSGVNAETAVMGTTNQGTLNPGQTLWYGFNYAGDGSQINIALNANGQSGLTLSVMTPNEVQQFEGGQGMMPVGMGSANPNVQGADLFWSGNFNQAGVYYVVVTNNATTPIGYTLTVTGGSVW